MSYLMLASGLAVLVIAGDLLVRGSVSLAEKLHIPPIIIGLTVVAFGTSAPELLVSIKAALAGAPGIAVGNVVGSNIANVLLVLGIPALIHATNCNQPFVVRNSLFMFGSSIIFTALCFAGPLGLIHGIILVTLLAIFLIESARRAMKTKNGGPTQAELEMIDGVECVPRDNAVMLGFIAIGFIGLPIAAHLTVGGASNIARSWGISDAAIGLTIVAIGTSLPELAATVMAAIRKQGGLAIGNVLGSNMFNLLAIMGITSLVTEVDVPASILRMDIWIMLATTVFLMPFVLRRRAIGMPVGVVFVACYVCYIAVVFHAGTVGYSSVE